MADLKQLKNELLDELIKITDESGADPLDKFDIVMARYINTGDQELLAQAMEVAKTIEEPKERGNAMMQLLDEVDLAQTEDSENKDAKNANLLPSNKELSDSINDNTDEDVVDTTSPKTDVMNIKKDTEGPEVSK